MSLSRPLLIRKAEELTLQLSRYRTPQTGAPVDPSIVASVLRFVVTRPNLPELNAFLEALPSSSVGMLTRSSGPQTQEVVRRTRALAAEVGQGAAEDELMEGLAYVLGWTRRLLVSAERGAPASVGRER